MKLILLLTFLFALVVPAVAENEAPVVRTVAPELQRDYLSLPVPPKKSGNHNAD